MMIKVTFLKIFKYFSILSTILFSSHLYSYSEMVNKTQTGIPLDSVWKQKIYDFAKENVKHSAWGIAHSERNYQLSISLAKRERLNVDTDVIFAAAFLHDLGAIEPHRKPNVDHSIQSAEIAEELLKSYGFPMKKWPIVKDTILSHMYYAELPKYNEGVLFRDADALDFFGIIGIIRIVSITERHNWSPSLSGAFTTLSHFKAELPGKLITESAKLIAKRRIKEMDQLFILLNKETFYERAL